MWKKINGFSAYEVSDEGVVRKKRTGLTLKSKHGTVRLVNDAGNECYRSLAKIIANEFSKEISGANAHAIRYTINRIIRFKEEYPTDYSALVRLVEKSKANMVKQKEEEKRKREMEKKRRETREINKIQKRIENLQKKLEKYNRKNTDSQNNKEYE